MIDYRRYYLLADWPRWAQAVVTILIAIILALALLLFLPDASGEAPSPSPSKHEAHFIQLDREALDAAYKQHIMRLFDVWVTDYNPNVKEPPRAVRGARNGRAAYEQAAAALDERERLLAK